MTKLKKAKLLWKKIMKFSFQFLSKMRWTKSQISLRFYQNQLAITYSNLAIETIEQGVEITDREDR